MSLNLKNRDSVGELIAYVKMGSEHFYCIAAVEYWIGEYWNGYVSSDTECLEEEYFNFLEKFRVDFNDLKDGYKHLIELNDLFELEANKPQLYIDFQEKYFASYFQEQELENRVAIGWKGEYKKIENLIEEEYRYWSSNKLA